MGRSFALFVAENLPADFIGLCGGDLNNGRDVSRIYSSVEWTAVGQSVDTFAGEIFAGTIQDIQTKLQREPVLLDDELVKQIQGLIRPPAPLPTFGEETAGTLDIPALEDFLKNHKGKKISWFYC